MPGVHAGQKASGPLEMEIVNASLWMLGVEPGYCGRTASALNQWVISLAPGHAFLTTLKGLVLLIGEVNLFAFMANELAPVPECICKYLYLLVSCMLTLLDPIPVYLLVFRKAHSVPVL